MTNGVLWTPTSNQVQPLAHAAVQFTSPALLYGASLFETLRVRAGRVFQLPAHVNRLRAGLATLGWPDVLPATVHEGIAAVVAALTPHTTDVRVRVTVCYAGPELGADLYVQGQAYVPPPSVAYTEGVDAVVTEYTVHAASPLMQLKTGQRLPFMLAQAEAHARTAWEGLLLTPDGLIADGSVSNVHCVINGTIVTPGADSGALPGIARLTVCQLARVHGIEWRTDACSLCMLTGADEAFLTNSVVGVLPLVRLDSQHIGSGRPGPITRTIMAFYEARRQTRSRAVGN